jgi:hypothetical protein
MFTFHHVRSHPLFKAAIVLIALFLTLPACSLGMQAATPRPVNLGITPSATIITVSQPTIGVTATRTNTPTTSSSGSQNTVPPTAVYNVALPAPAPDCSVMPNGAFSVNIRRNATTNSDVIGLLLPASWVKVSQMINGWYQVDYAGTPVHTGWIAAQPVVLIGSCLCPTNQACRIATVGPNTPVPVTQAPVTPASDFSAFMTRCEAVNATSAAINVFSSSDGVPIAQLSPSQSAPLVSLGGTDWYVVYLRDKVSTGWVRREGTTPSGDCQNVLSGVQLWPASSCIATNTTSSPIGIWAGPDSTNPSNLFTRLGPNESTSALSKFNGWVAVYRLGCSLQRCLHSGWMGSTEHSYTQWNLSVNLFSTG